MEDKIKQIILKHSRNRGDYLPDYEYDNTIKEIIGLFSNPLDAGVIVKTVGWISVKDKLPEKRQSVLTYNPLDKDDLFWVDYLFLDANKELRWDIGKDEVTHWMPLPETPK